MAAYDITVQPSRELNPCNLESFVPRKIRRAIFTPVSRPLAEPHPGDPEKNKIRFQQFLLILRGAIGAR